MKLSALLAAGCIGTCALFTALVAPEAVVATFLGMAAPLAVGIGTVVMIERTVPASVDRLTQRMTVAFLAKAVFYGAYVGAVVALAGVAPAPFVTSFTAYFVALQFTEALYLKTLLSRIGQTLASH